MMHVNASLEMIPAAPYTHGGIHHPASIFSLWSRAEKLAIGIYEVVPDEVPEGKVAVSWALVMDDGFVRRVPTLVDYVEPVPQVVSRAQGKLALIGAGLWQDVVEFVGELTDPTEKAIAETALYDTTEWRRDSPFLGQAASALELDEDDLDDLFRTAAQIEI